MIDLNAAKSAANKLKSANDELEQAISKLKKAKEYVCMNGSNNQTIPVLTAIDKNLDEIESVKATINNSVVKIRSTAQTIYDRQVAEAEAAARQAASRSTYTVERGDTLWAIAKANNTTVERLKSLNGLAGDTINIGQKLKVG